MTTVSWYCLILSQSLTHLKDSFLIVDRQIVVVQTCELNRLACTQFAFESVPYTSHISTERGPLVEWLVKFDEGDLLMLHEGWKYNQIMMARVQEEGRSDEKKRVYSQLFQVRTIRPSLNKFFTFHQRFKNGSSVRRKRQSNINSSDPFCFILHIEMTSMT